MNENNRIVDFSKVRIVKPESKPPISNQANRKRKTSHFKSISKNQFNFLIEYKKTEIENNSFNISASECQEQDKRMIFPIKEFPQDSNSTILSYHVNCSNFSFEAEDLQKSKDEVGRLPLNEPQLIIINFEHYEKNSEFLHFMQSFYQKLLAYFDNIISDQCTESSFSLIADWFEVSKNETFYNVNSNKIYLDPLNCAIVKEYIMLELISINLHLLILNKVQEFSSTSLKDFYTSMRDLFRFFYDSFVCICKLGMNSNSYQLQFLNNGHNAEYDMTFISSNSKEVKKTIRVITRLIKENLNLNESETYCYKHLKSLFKSFLNEYYDDLKTYSYNVYLFSGLFVNSENDNEKSYCISNVTDNKEDTWSSSSYSNLPPVPFLTQPSHKPYTIVVDLDETLIHCVNVS